MEKDVYQERYLNHQQRKANILMNSYGTKNFRKYTNVEREIFFEMLNTRCSQRGFNKEDIDLKTLLWAIDKSPSSCDRKGVGIRVIGERDDKDLLSGLLVGGVGWVNRAHTILLLVADMEAYKSPAERDFMPYLDAGVMVQTGYLACEAMNIGCCFVNPNVREENQELFRERFGFGDSEVFCGALAIGAYDKKHRK